MAHVRELLIRLSVTILFGVNDSPAKRTVSSPTMLDFDYQHSSTDAQFGQVAGALVSYMPARKKENRDARSHPPGLRPHPTPNIGAGIRKDAVNASWRHTRDGAKFDSRCGVRRSKFGGADSAIPRLPLRRRDGLLQDALVGLHEAPRHALVPRQERRRDVVDWAAGRRSRAAVAASRIVSNTANSLSNDTMSTYVSGAFRAVSSPDGPWSRRPSSKTALIHQDTYRHTRETRPAAHPARPPPPKAASGRI